MYEESREPAGNTTFATSTNQAFQANNESYQVTVFIMGFKDQRFAKPAASFVGPSRSIYIAGLGDQLKTDKTKLVEFFSQFGELEDNDGDQGIYMPEGKRFIFISFVDCQVAEHVYSSLEVNPSIPSLNANNLQVKYAQLASTKKSTEPECTSSTDNIHVPGLAVIEDFITEEEESDMMEFYSSNDWKVSLQRRVQVTKHYRLTQIIDTFIIILIVSCVVCSTMVIYSTIAHSWWTTYAPAPHFLITFLSCLTAYTTLLNPCLAAILCLVYIEKSCASTS